MYRLIIIRLFTKAKNCWIAKNWLISSYFKEITVLWTDVRYCSHRVNLLQCNKLSSIKTTSLSEIIQGNFQHTTLQQLLKKTKECTKGNIKVQTSKEAKWSFKLSNDLCVITAWLPLKWVIEYTFTNLMHVQIYALLQQPVILFSKAATGEM